MTSTLPSKDPTLAPFLSPTFSAADYLNSVLPPWPTTTSSSTTTTSTTTAAQTQTPLAVLAHDAQTILTDLSSSLTRLTTTLSALTDDILRGGGRLAYEVEVLRADVGSLNEALTASGDAGLKAEFERLGVRGLPGDDDDDDDADATDEEEKPQPQKEQQQQQPEYIRTLHILARVRANLDRVVAVFGAATEWVLPPSELVGNSKINSSGTDDADAESKGQEYAGRVRDEVALLLEGEGEADGDVAGLEAAARRVREMRELVGVWKGTGEERARARFVDSLAKMVDEERARRGVSEVDAL